MTEHRSAHKEPAPVTAAKPPEAAASPEQAVAKAMLVGSKKSGSPYAGTISFGRQVLEERFSALEQRVEDVVLQQMHAATADIMQERASLERQVKTEIAASVAAVCELQKTQFELTERFSRLEAQFTERELQAKWQDTARALPGSEESADGSTMTLEILERQVRSFGECLRLQSQQLQEQRRDLYTHCTQVSIAVDVLSRRTLATEATTLAGASEQLQGLCLKLKQGSIAPVVNCGLESHGQDPTGEPALPPSNDSANFLLSAGSLEWVGPERAWLPTLGQSLLPGSRTPSPSVARKQAQPCFGSDGERAYSQQGGTPPVPGAGSLDCQSYPRVARQSSLGQSLLPGERGYSQQGVGPPVSGAGSLDCQSYPRVECPSSLGVAPKLGLRSAEAESHTVSPMPNCKGTSLSRAIEVVALHEEVSANAAQIVSPPVNDAFPPCPRSRHTSPSLSACLEHSSSSRNWGATSCSSTTATHNSSDGAGSPPVTAAGLLLDKRATGNHSAARQGFSAPGSKQIPSLRDHKIICRRDSLPQTSGSARLSNQRDHKMPCRYDPLPRTSGSTRICSQRDPLPRTSGSARLCSQ